MDEKKIAALLDFANHKAVSSEEEILDLCQKVKQFGFNAAFVNPCWVKRARKFLGKKGKVGTVISFPLGQETTQTKITAVLESIQNGANEVDVSSNIGWLKEGRKEDYLTEMMKIVKAAKKEKPGTVVKFIIEACLLTDEEIREASYLVLQSGADFVKTTSGFGPRDAKIKYVKIIRQAIGNEIKIKAAGGISTYQQVKEYLTAGASRIGTSRAVEIIKEYCKRK